MIRLCRSTTKIRVVGLINIMMIGNKPDKNPTMMENYSVYCLNKYMYKLKADWEIPIKGPLTFIIFAMTVITNSLLISIFVFRSIINPQRLLSLFLWHFQTRLFMSTWRGIPKAPTHDLIPVYNVFRMMSNLFLFTTASSGCVHSVLSLKNLQSLKKLLQLHS